MHRCLEIEEILVNVFEYVHADHYEDEGCDYEEVKSDHPLRPVALCCQRFKEPALNVIWRERGDTRWLLMTMDVWREVRPPPNLYGYITHGPPVTLDPEISLTESRWSTLLSYGRRIRTLSSSSFSLKNMDVHSIRKLVDTFPEPKCITPNLHTLDLDLDDDDADFELALPFCSRLLGPRLKSLQITLPVDFTTDSGVHTFLSLIPQVAPNIEQLEIKTIHLREEVLDILQGFGSQFPRLKSFTCPDIDIALPHPIHTSWLKELVITEQPLVEPLPTKSRVQFPNLESLRMSTLLLEEDQPCEYSAAAFLPTLRRSALPTLRSLELAIDVPDPQEMPTPADWSFEPLSSSWTPVFQAIGVACSNAHLQSISITVRADGSEPTGGPGPNDSLDLGALFGFGNITTCSIEVPSLVVDTQLIWSVSTSWPELRTLSLGNPMIKGTDTSLRLRDLEPLARHCLKLSSLKIRVNQHIQAEDLKIETSPHREPLELYVSDSPVADLTGTAIVLSALFPGLKEIQPYLNKLAAWKIVEQMVHGLVPLRALERQRGRDEALALAG